MITHDSGMRDTFDREGTSIMLEIRQPAFGVVHCEVLRT